MDADSTFALAGLLLLGAVHGINPGMGWLFAVALGLQRQRRGAVWGALLPLAAGHALAIGAVVGIALAAGLVIPPRELRWAVAAALLGLGVFHLIRHRHPRWGGMQVGAKDLAIWSFLMATAHGAGLMILPLVLEAAQPLASTVHTAHAASAGAVVHASGHTAHAASLLTTAGGPMFALLATASHSVGYLLVTGALAVIVYEKLGLRLLRSAWMNIDLIWAGALVATAVLTLVI